jgi:hypothetical protein
MFQNVGEAGYYSIPSNKMVSEVYIYSETVPNVIRIVRSYNTFNDTSYSLTLASRCSFHTSNGKYRFSVYASSFVPSLPVAIHNMATTDGYLNGHSLTQDPRFDPNFTQHVIDAIGPKTSPRMRQVMSSLIRHVHDFARENELTVEEWMKGVELLNWAGKMSDDKRNEGQLVCDVIGLES